MLLNKVFCLDKGWVALISSSNDWRKLEALRDEFFFAEWSDQLYKLGTLTLAIRCPLFIQLNLSKFNFILLSTKTQEVEAFLPDAGDIKSGDLQADKLIADDIRRTTEALLINPKAYQADGCDHFTSQLLSPVNIYTTLIVHGSYNEWSEYCKQKGLPAALEQYVEAARSVLLAEWKDHGTTKEDSGKS